MLYRTKSSVVTYLFSAYFISIYVSLIIAKNCGFVMEFEILAIYFRLKNSFLLLFLMKISKIQMTFKNKSSIVRYYSFPLLDTLTFNQYMLFFQNFGMDFHI